MIEDEGITEEYRARVYVGSSKKRDDPDFSLQKALEDAYRKASQDGRTPPFRVLETWIHGDNPLSEYRVVIGASG